MAILLNFDILFYMFPPVPLWINDDLDLTTFSERNIKRRHHIMQSCQGPLIILAPPYGPNRHYAWANCYQPVYQNNDIIYLTGINQLDIAILLDPDANHHHIFIPEYSKKTAFWDGAYFGYGDADSHQVLTQMGFTHIHNKAHFQDYIQSNFGHVTEWTLPPSSTTSPSLQDEHHQLRQFLTNTCKQAITDFNGCLNAQQFKHDDTAIKSIQVGVLKTKNAFIQTLQDHPFSSETHLSGTLIGHLLKESCFGLSFSPIIATNQNASILHYTQNSATITPDDLILMDFGIRWQSMCTDVSRTIPAKKTYAPLYKRLMDIVLDVQIATIQQVRSGVSFSELNQFAWERLNQLLQTQFVRKGGRFHCPYQHQPHQIGHLLGIQVHDGDPQRSYATQPLQKHSIITIEPGLYGYFEFGHESATLGICIEDNLLVLDDGNTNLTADIPKTCEEIEALLKHRN